MPDPDQKIRVVGIFSFIEGFIDKLDVTVTYMSSCLFRNSLLSNYERLIQIKKCVRRILEFVAKKTPKKVTFIAITLNAYDIDIKKMFSASGRSTKISFGGDHTDPSSWVKYVFSLEKKYNSIEISELLSRPEIFGEYFERFCPLCNPDSEMCSPSHCNKCEQKKIEDSMS